MTKKLTTDQLIEKIINDSKTPDDARTHELIHHILSGNYHKVAK